MSCGPAGGYRMGKVPVTRSKGDKKAKLRNNELISKYHAKINELNAHESVELEEMGGFQAYQNASMYGTKHGDTSKWLLKHLQRLNVREKGEKVRLLDVGALAHNYAEVKWMEAEAIDLHPRLPGILRCDFTGEYEGESSKDIVCLSLVLNFVGDPHARGAMLQKAFRVLRTGGLLFLVLPRACIMHSRYMSMEYLLALCKTVGFDEAVPHHLSPKLVYLLLRKGDSETGQLLPEPSITAAGYNNFKIRLGASNVNV